MEKNRSPLIGIIINQINGRYQSELRYGFGDYAHQHGISYRYFVGKSLNSPYGSENEQNSIYSCAETMDIDALIICTGSIGTFLKPDELTAFVNRYNNIPIVTIGLPVDKYPCIAADNSQCIINLVQHLIHDHKYKHIAFLSGPSNSIDAQTRKNAFLQALKSEGYEPDPALIFDGDFSYNSGVTIALKLQKQKTLPFDAIVCANDDMAFGFIDTMRAAGFVPPKDYAITGIDDVPDAQFYRPPLTTVNQFLYMQGYNAAKKAVTLIHGNLLTEHDSTVRPHLCIRESCGCTTLIKNKSRRIPPVQIEETLNAAIQIPQQQELLSTLSIAGIPVSCISTLENAVTALYTQLSLDIRTFRSEPLFILTLNEWFDITAETWQNFSGIWEHVLQQMQNHIMEQLTDIRTYAYTEHVFMSALSLLTYKINKVNAAYVLLVRKTMAAACEYSALFAHSPTEEHLHTQIQQMLATFNLPYIDLFCHNEQLPCSYAVMKHYHITPTAIEDKQSTASCTSPETTLIMPLICAHRSYGYISLPDKAEEPLIYELIREMISQGTASVAAVSITNIETLHTADMIHYADDYANTIPLLILETDSAMHIVSSNKAAKNILKLCQESGSVYQSLRTYLAISSDEVLSAAVQTAQTEEKVDLPEIRISVPDSNMKLPVLRIENVPDKFGSRILFRWSILEPLSVAAAAIMPDDSFFQEHNISQREKEMMLYVLQGLRIRDIAAKTFIAESTVKGHLSRIYDKLDVKNRSQLCDLMRRNTTHSDGMNAYIFSLLTGALSINE